MAKCLRLAGQPPSISISLPGGAKLGSIPSQTQNHPNALDPASSLMQAASPAIAAIKPVIDVVSFVIALLQLMITLHSLQGAALSLIGYIGNPLSILFPLPNIKDSDGKDIQPPIPDISETVLNLVEELIVLVCRGLKLINLAPQLSAVATIKDTLITVLQLMDAVQGEVNSTLDRVETIIPATTGDPIVDQAIECAQERLGDALGGKLGVLASLMPVMELVQTLVDIASQPMPRTIYTMAELAINAQVISFPDEESKQTVLDLVDQMTTTGIPVELPDFGDLSDLVSKMQEIKDKLEPLLPVIETVQVVVSKLTNC